VLIRFRSKHIFLERLHYQLSTDLGMLQANMTYAQKEKGPAYHWIPHLYKQLKLPVYDGVQEALERFGKVRQRELNRKKKETTKHKRIQHKITRKKEQEVRKVWSKQHGADTYGTDLEAKEKPAKLCKCRSSSDHFEKLPLQQKEKVSILHCSSTR